MGWWFTRINGIYYQTIEKQTIGNQKSAISMFLILFSFNFNGRYAFFMCTLMGARRILHVTPIE